MKFKTIKLLVKVEDQLAVGDWGTNQLNKLEAARKVKPCR